MRAIKFRAWDINNKKMFRINRIDYRDDNLEIREVRRASELPINIADQMYYDLLEIELMQYTGLVDKNGTEIYEGDIVKGKAIDCQGGFTYIGVIEFLTHNTVHGWHLREFDGGGYELKQLQARISLDNITGEVIGNIYEHPHLLKE